MLILINMKVNLFVVKVYHALTAELIFVKLGTHAVRGREKEKRTVFLIRKQSVSRELWAILV